MGFGHIGEIIILLLLALIIFGPKRLIEMGSQLGKSLRETRDALKEMNWSLTGDEEETSGSSTGDQRDRLHIVESASTSSAPPSDES